MKKIDVKKELKDLYGVSKGELIRTTVSAGCAQLGDDRHVSKGLSVAPLWPGH